MRCPSKWISLYKHNATIKVKLIIGLNRSKIDGSTSKTLQGPRKQRETIPQIDYQLYKLEVGDDPNHEPNLRS